MHAAAFLAVIALVTTGAGAEVFQVNTEPSVNAKPGEKVTLTCSFKENVAVRTFQWIFRKEVLCDFTGMKSVEPNNFQCGYTDDKTVVLTIERAQLDNNGTYICKLYAETGHGVNKTELHVSEEKVTADTRQAIKQEPNQACISGSKWINLLGSLTVLLVLILYSSR